MKSKKELIDAVVEAIKIDIECCYTEAIEELLTFLPIENLIEFLPEELWKNYQHLKNK